MISIIFALIVLYHLLLAENLNFSIPFAQIKQVNTLSCYVDDTETADSKDDQSAHFLNIWLM